MLVNELEKIGLSEKEAKVYLAALELGQAPVQNIATKAGVNRATTYVVLESLMAKGLITVHEEGKKRFFIAESPYALHNVIGEQQEELKRKGSRLDGLMPELQTFYNLHPNKPIVRFYEGKEGLKTIIDEMHRTGAKEAHTFYSLSDVRNLFHKDEAQSTRKSRVKKGTKIYAVYTDKQQDSRTRSERHAERRRVPAEKFPIYSDISIYEDKVSIASLTGQVSGVLIESAAIADTFRSIFKLAFEAAEKYDEED